MTSYKKIPSCLLFNFPRCEYCWEIERSCQGVLQYNKLKSYSCQHAEVHSGAFPLLQPTLLKMMEGKTIKFLYWGIVRTVVSSLVEEQQCQLERLMGDFTTVMNSTPGSISLADSHKDIAGLYSRSNVTCWLIGWSKPLVVIEPHPTC